MDEAYETLKVVAVRDHQHAEWNDEVTRGVEAGP